LIFPASELTQSRRVAKAQRGKPQPKKEEKGLKWQRNGGQGNKTAKSSPHSSAKHSPARSSPKMNDFDG
jgi:hypothetical protein